MLYRKIIAFVPKSTHNTNTLWGLNVELLNVKPDGTKLCSYVQCSYVGSLRNRAVRSTDLNACPVQYASSKLCFL